MSPPSRRTAFAFCDHFGASADDYARHRPRYPEALFDLLAKLSPRRRMAWDCATGSGQGSAPLAKRFRRVLATDASLGQLARAPRGALRPANVRFAAAVAEAAPLGDASVDLIAVGQALHWFDFDAFYREVRRVLAPGGLLAAWTYDLVRITPEIDALVSHFEREEMGSYWPPESAHVDARYATIPFPFDRLDLPEIEMKAEWSLDTLFGYISSWSAVGRYRAAHRRDPLESFEPRLRGAWGEPATREARWPLTVLATRLGRAARPRSTRRARR